MNTIKQHIKKNEYKNYYLLYGSEAYLKRLYKKKLKEAMLDGSDDMNYTYAEGKEINADEILRIGMTLPFFSERRVIVIENSGWFKTSGSFVDGMQELPDTTFVVFVETEVDKRNRLYKAIKSSGYIAEMNGLDEKNLKLWVASMLKQQEFKITEATISYLLNKVGSNMDNIESEIRKLTSYCMGRDIITVEDIDAICSEQITGKMFVMLDYIATRNQKNALKLYDDLLQLREKPMTILYLLIRHMNLLLQVKGYLKKHVDSNTIASKLSIPSFAVNKYAKQGQTFSKDMLIKAITLGTQMEEEVKTGRLNDQIAVELLLIQIMSF